MARRDAVDDAADDLAHRLRALGSFDEEVIQTAVLMHWDEPDHAAAWLLDQPQRPSGGAAAQPTVLQASSRHAGPSSEVDRNVIADRALRRDARQRIAKREKEMARQRAEKEAEQAPHDRKKSRAREQAERNKAKAAASGVPAERAALAKAAEGRAGRDEHVAVGARRVVPAATRDAPAAAPAFPADGQMLQMLLQQDLDISPADAARAVAHCIERGMLQSVPLLRESGTDGRQMRATMYANFRSNGKASAAPAQATAAPSSSRQASPRAPAPAAPPPAPSPAAIIAAQNEDYEASLEADRKADEARANAAQTDSGASTDEEPELTQAELREKRIAALATPPRTPPEVDEYENADAAP